MPFPKFKIGDKVRVPTWMAIHGRYNRGTVTYVNGGYIGVRLNFKAVDCDMLINEVLPGWRNKKHA